LLRRLWHDDGGAILASEWLLLTTILILGLLPGIIVVRQAIIGELADVGNAAASLDQSYSFCGQKAECPCWDPYCHDGRWGWDGWDRRRPWWDNANPRVAAGKGVPDRRPGRDAWTDRDRSPWDRRWGVAATAGSQFVNPRPRPTELGPGDPRTIPETDPRRIQPCD
jgi:hypothetical protein